MTAIGGLQGHGIQGAAVQGNGSGSSSGDFDPTIDRTDTPEPKADRNPATQQRPWAT
jgi:hypothetical protein